MGENEFVKRFPLYTNNMEVYWASLARWLDSKGARIVGMVDGEVQLALEDKDFKKLRKELFGNIKREDKNEVKEA